MLPIFFYGSLRDRELIEIVLGRAVAPADLAPARAAGFATRRARGEDYPMLVPEAGAVAEGVLLSGLSAADLERLAYFEEAEYALAPITVETAGGTLEARHFRPTGKRPAVAELWNFADWQREHRPVAHEAACELMALHGEVPVERIDDHWPAILVRARQRARALSEPGPMAGGIRSRFGPSDVEVAARRRVYRGFVAVDEMRLRHKRFDGSWSAEMGRTAVLWGDAVTVLPYDARRDRVLLIEQFRPAPMARGDRCPWCIEVIAGRVDADEDAVDTARREAREEAGLELGCLVETGLYYTTPGLSAEALRGFVGEADLPHAGGLYGLDGEHEDIRAFVLDFDVAMAAVGRGEVNTGPALVALLWLAANRGGLRRAWAGQEADTGS
ncbi:hypothetical protein LNKW23_29790 [Paralimibaculum aggregatum]|uniref:Putative gamma-glutamylcyclotransferase n=1 Tax=Paralimibaculum aggregatum TaxID=3036245 RepID=A0ABQ6LNA3_9RHOB|nr:gamma-glutamylcyclotransferase [Limibaculum sp. NKW23]GMG83765.1 hypothetical protein LNKW23_29790 [Limibaculum sp. NKW23]